MRRSLSNVVLPIQEVVSVETRRAKSMESSSRKSIQKPLMILEGAIDGKKITVYGEIHNKIDNRFYESLDLKNKTIMVEHATVLCDLKPGDNEKLLSRNPFTNQRILKGSEWIWHKCKITKKPVICIDNRLELGLLSAIEEKLFASENLDDKSHKLFMNRIFQVLETLTNDEIRDQFQIHDILQTIYNNSIQIIVKQYNELVDRKSKITRIKLINNIKSLSSFIVDLNIMEKILTTKKGKNINIFVGAKHAYRLVNYFSIFEIIHHSLTNEMLDELEKVIYP